MLRTNCYGEVANLLRTCYGETGVMVLAFTHIPSLINMQPQGWLGRIKKVIQSLYISRIPPEAPNLA